ncbi:hypothetical protein ACFZAG_35540 [Streptomyces sp. NPDC012403]|uniref:hypothetical protein n=1 Tax=Streptomyces sp. NPDC012403 TaxID=3364831 RepID=UPI0036EC13F7
MLSDQRGEPLCRQVPVLAVVPRLELRLRPLFLLRLVTGGEPGGEQLLQAGLLLSGDLRDVVVLQSFPGDVQTGLAGCCTLGGRVGLRRAGDGLCGTLSGLRVLLDRLGALVLTVAVDGVRPRDWWARMLGCRVFRMGCRAPSLCVDHPCGVPGSVLKATVA